MNNHIVVYSNNKYIVLTVKYKKLSIPVVLDYAIYLRLSKLIDINTFLCNSKGHVYMFYNNNISFLHDMILNLYNSKRSLLPVVHINKLSMDCRLCNLMYDVVDKNVNKNLNKKARTIKLPKETNININEIPTFVWYLKPDDSHGERFMVSIDNISWKSTSQNNLSLRYKLEETKKYLRYLKKIRPDIFKKYSLNGDLNDSGEKLKQDYYNIINKAGFNYCYTKKINTDNLLKQNLNHLSKHEILLLNQKIFD